MAGYFNIAYPPNEDYIRFNGGQNSKIQKNLILDNQSPDCLNVVIEDDAVGTRPGTAKLNTAAVGTFACDGLYTRHTRNSTAESMCAWFGGTMYVLSGTTFNAIASGVSLYTAGTRVFAVEYQNHIFFGGGSENIPSKYNGVALTRQGIYPPTTAAAAAIIVNSGAGSNLSGDYVYGITYVNSGLVESDISPITTTFSFAATGASLACLPVAPQSWGVSARNIYRSEVASFAVLYYAGTISNNTATTFVDNVLDAALGDPAPIDQNVPPNYGPCLYHNSRLFVIGRYPGDNDDRVYYSDVGNPYVFGTTNFINIGDNTGDTPKALGLWDNYLIVTGARGTTWLIYMPDIDDANWVQLRLRSQYGSKSPLGMFEAMNFLIFPAVEKDKFVGFGALSSAGLEPTAEITAIGSVGSDLISTPIENEMFAINNAYLHKVASIVYKNKAYIAMPTGSSTYNNRMFLFDFSRSGLQKEQKYTWLPWTGINASQFTVYEGNLYYASADATGFVYAMNQTLANDSGTAINSYWWTKEFPGQPAHSTWYKDWRFVNLLYELVGAYKMGLTIRVDSDQGSGLTYDLDCAPGGSLWGTMVWGINQWNAGQESRDLKYPLGQFRGKRVQFKFSNKNTLNQKFKVIGLNLTYNLKGKR
jgi:hypothetical protein